jgi:uncharacterized protein
MPRSAWRSGIGRCCGRFVRSAAGWLLVVAVCAGQARVEKQLDVMVPMRDGVRLSTNIFRPAGAGRWPVVLVRTPYNKGPDLAPSYVVFLERGYAMVVQDVRGRYESQGVFRPLEQEGPDGEDTLKWIGRQAWCDGNVGMIGGSYSGMAQWQAALRNPPNLKAIFPLVSGYDDYLDRFYSRGGGFKLGHRLMWIQENLRLPYFRAPQFGSFIYHLPLRSADRLVSGRPIDFYQDALNHPSYDDFWLRLSTRANLERITVPVFAAGGWFDNYAQSDLEVWAAMRRMGKEAHVMIGPWAHNFGEKLSVDYGPDAAVSIRRLQLEWFDRWLKGLDTGVVLAPARVFTMGENRWQDLTSWPPETAVPMVLYLDGKRANSLNGDGVLLSRRPKQEARDHYTYDPRKPVFTSGGPVCCNSKVMPPGPMDQWAVEQRQDVLVYTSGVLEADLEVTGVVRALLWVATSAPDTDFMAKLVEVNGEGVPRSVTDGMLRMRYRRGLERAVLVEPGRVYPAEIDMGVTSYVFRAGNRIRMEVSSSNFPRFDRNPNTGRAIADEKELKTARQTVVHGGRYGSMLVLPVMRRVVGGRRNGY